MAGAFSGFYTENKKGDNTMENAKYYTSARTQSGKLTVDSKIYNELLATGMTTSQVEALYNSEQQCYEFIDRRTEKYILRSEQFCRYLQII